MYLSQWHWNRFFLFLHRTRTTAREEERRKQKAKGSDASCFTSRTRQLLSQYTARELLQTFIHFKVFFSLCDDKQSNSYFPFYACFGSAAS